MQKYILRFIYCFVLRLFLKLIVGVKFDNASFLEKENQFVILSNHNSHLDTLSIMASLPPSIIHKVKPVAAGDYFGRNKIISWLSRFFLNAVLLERNVSDKKSKGSPLSVIEKAINEGYSLILFPEGTRGQPEKMKTLKRGIGIVLSKNKHVKYVPAYLDGMGKNLPKGNVLIVPYNAKIKYGTPKKVISDDSKEIMNQIENDIISLKAELH
ncbi:MAG: lysophospholipid acyltransferase family protein [Balneola sp.]